MTIQTTNTKSKTRRITASRNLKKNDRVLIASGPAEGKEGLVIKSDNRKDRLNYFVESPKGSDEDMKVLGRFKREELLRLNKNGSIEN